jgi:hypothetical protein
MKPIYKVVRMPICRPGHRIDSDKDYNRTRERMVLMYTHKCECCGEKFESECKEDIYCSFECASQSIEEELT